MFKWLKSLFYRPETCIKPMGTRVVGKEYAAYPRDDNYCQEVAKTRADIAKKVNGTDMKANRKEFIHD